MQTKCPHCKQLFEAEDQYAGCVVDCQCGKSFTIEPLPENVSASLPQTQFVASEQKQPSRTTGISHGSSGLLVRLCFLLLIGVPVVTFAANYFLLQVPLNSVINADYRNKGIDVNVHYRYYCDFSQPVFNINSIAGDKAPIDVFRVFLQYSQAMKGHSFARVILASQGREKFFIDGSYFRKLGTEYDAQNPIYTLRTFPENVYTLAGQHAFRVWKGGALGVFSKQMEDFKNFQMQWYIEDLSAKMRGEKWKYRVRNYEVHDSHLGADKLYWFAILKINNNPIKSAELFDAVMMFIHVWESVKALIFYGIHISKDAIDKVILSIIKKPLTAWISVEKVVKSWYFMIASITSDKLRTISRTLSCSWLANWKDATRNGWENEEREQEETLPQKVFPARN